MDEGLRARLNGGMVDCLQRVVDGNGQCADFQNICKLQDTGPFGGGAFLSTSHALDGNVNISATAAS